ncbi:hypothetical protein Rhopal_004550-T1 [Rhodotorula paludigena]|uniref:Extracellular metalloproteinase n=1 Tax=Rhodotorula paludigena TaxID=86838 RepID=A0AAV5GQ87_9BASI|nr:hypothetical protein Rhopal_004550-T1 [Rhodotorula paludigena]
MYTHTHHRSRRSRLTLARSLVSTASLACLGSALVVPPTSAARTASHATSLDSLAGTSSIRKSINLGPTVTAVTHDDHANPSPPLSVWNANHFASVHAIGNKCDSDRLRSDSASDVARCVGTELAKSFVAHLHPDADFRLTDATLSRHSGVVHAHFVQTIEGVPVANGNVNVNVDLATGKVLSYGDSSFVGAVKAKEAGYSKPRRESAWKQRVQSWAAEAVDTVEQAVEQVVFGGSASDNAPQGSARSRSPAVDAADPREALLTFLAIQSSNVQLSQRLESAPRPQLVDEMRVVAEDSDAKHDFVIHTAHEELDEPVKTTLTYVHDGEDLKLTWKYEIKTRDNMYEAYMTADKSITPGDDEALLVVDWVRDFKPTGGELGLETMALFGGARTLQRAPHVQDFAGRVPESVTSAPVASTTDKEEVRKMRLVKPSYKVYPWGVNAPDEGKRAVLNGTLVELDKEASPAGWHTVPGSGEFGASTRDTFYYETRGNNVLAQDNPSGGNSMNGFRANGGKDMRFQFGIHMTKPGTPLDPATYINASVTELFYTNNEYHDLLYRYGFDEESGNFQEHNFGRGGRGGDAVQANAQDGSGYNNANLERDGDFEAGIVIHEYSHGLSTRLTGGPANSGCLGWGEAGGMGEGWGDALATLIRMHDANITTFSMGEWASGRAGGIRNYPYSRSKKVNPSTYSILDKGGYWGVHAIGEVWAEMLFDVTEALMDVYGFHPTLFPPPVNGTDSTGYYNQEILAKTGKKVPAHGNTLAVQLIVDGMKLQPCRPSFADARDAILTADHALTGGANYCTIYSAFANRGLGPRAELVGGTPWGGGRHEEDFEVPKRCGKKKGGKKGRKETF